MCQNPSRKFLALILVLKETLLCSGPLASPRKPGKPPAAAAKVDHQLPDGDDFLGMTAHTPGDARRAAAGGARTPAELRAAAGLPGGGAAAAAGGAEVEVLGTMVEKMAAAATAMQHASTSSPQRQGLKLSL